MELSTISLGAADVAVQIGRKSLEPETPVITDATAACVVLPE
jgi:hypothetical protein